ncbi:MAG TPA: hypothetical protein VJJ78_03110, partial [Candidatus Saccharimonadales bacterium]|nr:hypothetical protein [Candidatus Saccharimonadales bacterium]
TAEILDGTIADADTNAALTGASLAADTLVAGDIATGGVATTEILDGTIADADTNGALTGAALAADTLVAGDIATGAVANAELADSISIPGVLTLGRQTLTVTDDGTANDTLTPTSNYVELSQDGTGNAGTPDITLTEGSATEGDLLIIVRIDSNAGNVTINESDGVAESAGNITTSAGEFDSVSYIYTGDTWAQISASENG